MQAGKALEQTREEDARVIVGASEPDASRQARTCQLGHRLIVRPQDLVRMSQEAFAVEGECNPTTGPDHERLLDDLLQLLDLLTQGRLCPADLPRRAAHHGSVRDGDEIAQQINVEANAHAIIVAYLSRRSY